MAPDYKPQMLNSAKTPANSRTRSKELPPDPPPRPVEAELIDADRDHTVATASQLTGGERRDSTGSVSQLNPGASSLQRRSLAGDTAPPPRKRPNPPAASSREEELPAANHQKEAELQQLRAENEEIRRDWRVAISDLNRLQADRNYKVDDVYVLSSWQSLRYEIKNWAVRHFDGEIVATFPRKPSPKDFETVTPQYKAYLKQPKLRPLIIQSFIWYKLREEVFTNLSAGYRGRIWAGHSADSFKKLSDVLRPHSQVSPLDLKDYHRWRSLTVALLESRVSEGYIDEKIKSILGGITPVLSSLITSEPEARQNLPHSLAAIIAKAISLDADLQKQRAVFTITPVALPRGTNANGRQGVLPNPHDHQQDDDMLPIDEGRMIQLIVVPGLKKEGNADGEQYDQISCLAKSRVVQYDQEDATMLAASPSVGSHTSSAVTSPASFGARGASYPNMGWGGLSKGKKVTAKTKSGWPLFNS